jgi:hypothetical protein
MDTKVTTTEALGHLIRAARLAQGFTHELENATGFSPKFIY